MPKNLHGWTNGRMMGGFALLLFVTAPALADTQFRVKRMTRDDVPLGKGQCDIRLRVDGEAEVSVRGDMVSVRTISGRDARDDGSECNEPLPTRAVSDFNYEVRDRRGDIELLSEPTQRSGNRAVVRIRDNEGGEGRYHFRLTWQMDGRVSGSGGGFPPGPRGRGDSGDGRRDNYGDDPGADYPGSRGGTAARIGSAIDACSDAVSGRIAQQYRYAGMDILSIRADNGPGANDSVDGEVVAGSGRNSGRFSFSCQVDFNSGRLRNVSVQRR